MEALPERIQVLWSCPVTILLRFNLFKHHMLTITKSWGGEKEASRTSPSPLPFIASGAESNWQVSSNLLNGWDQPVKLSAQGPGSFLYRN